MGFLFGSFIVFIFLPFSFFKYMLTILQIQVDFFNTLNIFQIHVEHFSNIR